MSSWLLVASLAILMLIGLPIAFSLGLAGIGALILQGGIPLVVFPQRLWVSIDSFPLMSIVFFVISGELMLQGGISKRLINFVAVFFGWMRGSLAMISIMSCVMFGALSGSALATTAAIGSIMYPEMTKNNERDYGKVFTATLQAVGGTLGTMIPPSITLILYANITNTSIGDLFIAIVIPGLIMSGMYMAAAYFFIYKRGYALCEMEHRRKVDIKKAFLEGIWALLMPVIILGGVYSGIFTPTESAIVATVYALFVGKFIYKELTLAVTYKALVKAAIVSSTIMLLVATANFFGWVMAILNIPAMIMKFMMGAMGTKVMFLLVSNVIFLICGMFVDTTVIILLLIPLLYTAAAQLGINLIHYGAIACINLSMGMVTPPFGTSLFVAANMTGQKIEPMYKEAIPYCLMGCLGILLVTYIEPLSMVFVP